MAVMIDNFISTIYQLNRVTLQDDGESIFAVHSHSSRRFSILKDDLLAALSKTTFMSDEDSMLLVDDHSYEIVCILDSRGPVFRLNDINLRDDINNIDYSYNVMSSDYFISLLIKFSNLPPRSQMRFRSKFSRANFPNVFMHNKIDSLPQESNLLDYLKELIRFPFSVRIKTSIPTNRNKFDHLFHSFLFTISYNRGHAILPIYKFSYFKDSLKDVRVSRTAFEDMLSPKRIYKNELISYYQKGIGSQVAEHKYLSFYHILEYFFETIYKEDLLLSVKRKITHPSFSYKKDSDINDIINTIQKRTKIVGEEYSVNELEALGLVLKRFVPVIAVIKTSLNKIDPDLVIYYKSNKVHFSDGNAVNLDNGNDDGEYKNLAKRIYNTRNSIVHSKEGSRFRYSPFEDDELLLKEVTLLQVIVEEVILQDSKEL